MHIYDYFSKFHQVLGTKYQNKLLEIIEPRCVLSHCLAAIWKLRKFSLIFDFYFQWASRVPWWFLQLFRARRMLKSWERSLEGAQYTEGFWPSQFLLNLFHFLLHVLFANWFLFAFRWSLVVKHNVSGKL